MDTLNILHEQLLFATNYTQLLKSRVGQALSLFNFYRCTPNRLYYYTTKRSRPTAKACGLSRYCCKGSGFFAPEHAGIIGHQGGSTSVG